MKKLDNKTFYIGADDLSIDLFEGQYVVPEGISYNSYLIKDQKTAIMDTCDVRMEAEWKKNLSEALDGQIPDYLVVHHMEPDHSSLVAWAMEEYPSLTLVASAKAIQMFGQFFDRPDITGRTLAVKEGDLLDLGGTKLRFVAAPMVHWPEVMVSVDETDGVLYSADGFGKFGALGRCGFYGSDDSDWACEARRYYFNIVGKYGAPVQTLLKKLSGVSIREIRPLHGPVLNDNLGMYLSLYDTWSKYEPETDGVFIAAASIHGGTLAAAEKLAEILRSKGAPKVVVSDLCRSDIAENVEDAFRYPKMILAASTYDGTVFTPMFDFLHRLQIKGYTKRTVGLVENGSWAPSAARVMASMVGEMKDVTVVEPVVTLRSRMKDTDVPALEALADAILAQ